MTPLAWLVMIWLGAGSVILLAWAAWTDVVKRQDQWSEERPRGRDDW